MSCLRGMRQARRQQVEVTLPPPTPPLASLCFVLRVRHFAALVQDGTTALLYACSQGDTPIVRVLLAAPGVDQNLAKAVRGSAVLCCQRLSCPVIRIVTVLLRGRPVVCFVLAGTVCRTEPHP
jgi:hypothetical protein